MQTAFRPSVHGFSFPNSFPPGTPVVKIPSPIGEITIGDAQYGLCGGMIFAALDFFLWGQARYEERNELSIRYFSRRLIDSWCMPFGVMKYYDGQCRPGGSRFLAGVRVLEGLTRQTITTEWPKIKECLDTGMPAPLGIVNPYSYNPGQLARNHQVLAVGYELQGDDVTLNVYDPNHPLQDDTYLRFSLLDPDAEQLVSHSHDHPTRGLFLTQYSRPSDPPPLP
ncbi:MAG: hypothetical protein ACRC8S_05905 [Fimbriiglobus sp.]